MACGYHFDTPEELAVDVIWKIPDALSAWLSAVTLKGDGDKFLQRCVSSVTALPSQIRLHNT